MKNKELIITLTFFSIYAPLSLILWYESGMRLLGLIALLLLGVLSVLVFLVISLFFYKKKRFRRIRPIKIKRKKVIKESPSDITPARIRLKKEPVLKAEDYIEEPVEEPAEVVAFRLLFSDNKIYGGKSK